MMKIETARRIADLVNNEKWQGFTGDVRAAFQRLRMSAHRGNDEDRKLAKLLWDYGRINNGTLKPLNR